ncbi:MAG: DUF1730 domain-containing protein, partial [Planctomycetes bacterium]|nr:DUF1730 domain-containing protein [Planctomycetota bacterium]
MSRFFSDIKDLLMLEGFVKVGWAEACEIPKQSQAYFDDWIHAGKHGTMKFFERPEYTDAYKNPLTKYPFAKSIIAAVFPYNIYKSSDETYEIENKYKICRYALKVDYHHLITQTMLRVIEKTKMLHPDAALELQVD